MTTEELIRKIAFGGNGEPDFQSLVCSVTTVNGDVCDVRSLLTGGELKNVRLNATPKNEKGILITPKENSFVLVTMLSNTDSFVSMFSEIEKIEYKDESDCEVIIEEGKISLKNSKTAFWDELSALLDALAQAVVATPAGSGTFDAGTIQKITEVKTNLENLLC